MPGIPSALQPAAHAFVMAREDVANAVDGLTAQQLWMQPGGIAPLGFHIAHLTGSTDRLLTYARGETLSEEQIAAMKAEKMLSETRPSLDSLLAALEKGIGAALRQLASTTEQSLGAPRLVGRAQLPSTVLGLLFHAAEHAQRHTGQVVTTAKLVRGMTT
jgi:uncharacterized damage-inducible protein DinB